MANITGTAGNDILTGTVGDDVIKSFAGNDIINGSSGNDIINGGAGQDILEYDDAIISFDSTGNVSIEKFNSDGLNFKDKVTNVETINVKNFD